MSTIVTRAGKGSPLTNTELDSNFTNLNTDKAELSGATFTGNLNLGDGVSANFGASNDLTITHTGSSSILKENGTGTFYIQGTDIVFTNSAGSERYADFTDNGAVRLYHDNSIKLSTTSTGIDVTGSVVADGLTVDGGTASPIINLSRSGTYSGITFSQTVTNVTGAGADLSTYSLNANTGYVWQTCDSGGTTAKALYIAPNKDISFYNDSANQGLFWDSSTSQLRVGSTSAIFTNSVIQGVSALGPTIGAKQTTANQFAGGFWNNNSGDVSLIAFYAGFGGSQIGSIKGNSTSVQLLGSSGSGLSISSTGNVNIPNGGLMVGATTAPNSKLTVNTTTAGDGIELQSNGTSIAKLSRTTVGSTVVSSLDGVSGRPIHVGGVVNEDVILANAGGRVGIKTTPSAWGTAYAVLDLNTAGSIYGTTSGVSTASNLYFTGSAWLAKSTGLGTLYAQHSGTHNWYSSASVSAGSAAGLSTKMTLTADGNLLVGSSSTPSGSTDGTVIFASGTIASYRTGAAPAVFSRNASNGGEVVVIQQQGTSVGSIGTSNGDITIDASGGAGVLKASGTGQLAWANNLFYPITDNAKNLGTSSFRFKDLYLSNNATAQKLTLTKDPVGTYSIEVDGTNTGQPNLIVKQSTSERFRCDNNGNLLVGKTNNALANDGVVIREGGEILATNTSDLSANFNRLSTDGGIVGFYKDGTTVGSIGTEGGDLTIGTGTNCGIQFNDGNDAIRPFNMAGNSPVDNAVSLGISTTRFKDLYLSNAVKNSSGALAVESGGGGQLLLKASSELTFTSNTAERGRFDTSGNLLVGTTGANTYSSTVNTGVQIAPDFIGVARNQNTVMHLNRQGNDGTIVDFRTFGFVRGSVSISGSTTSYNTSSDERLKDNIIDAPIASEDIDAIQVRSFDWKADGEHQKYGMVAQELLEVAPDAVTQGDTPDDMMGVDYSKLVPMLIKEIQSLRQRVAQLEE